MSEQEKSLEDFVRDACARAMLGSPYHGSAPDELDAAIGKTALAVAARVREEIIAALHEIRGVYSAMDALRKAEQVIRAMNEASHR